MKNKIMLIITTLLLSGCANHWSETAPDGTRFEDAEPVCRAKAHASALHQIPLPFSYNQPGAAGFPPDSRHDIEYRETAWCLQQKGFRLIPNTTQ